jgi:two-component system cell cycle sensor histidine kinase/response regulator CckA
VLVVVLARMHRDLRGRQSEDQPPSADIDARETEHVFEERAIGIGFRARENDVCTVDHVASFPRGGRRGILVWGMMEQERAKIDALERQVAELRRALDVRASAPFGEGLHEREALLSMAERIVHLGSWMWDTATNTIYWSDELYRIFGLDPGTTLTTDTFFGGVHPDDVEHVRVVATRAMENVRAEPIDFRIVRPDGVVRQAHMEAAIVREEGGLRFVGTVLDVTERVAIDQRLRDAQKMEAIGILAGGVAHDFNNYLHVILGNVDLMIGRIAEATELEDGLVQIREAASRAAHLTRQLLLLGHRELPEPRVLSLDAMLDDAMPMLGTLVGDRIRIRRVRAGVDLRVLIGPGAIEQVVLNLALNARDAMPRGGRVTFDLDTIDIGPGDALPTEPALACGRYAVLAVEDEGCGISDEVLPRIFEPFYTTKDVGKGTGLGLATAYGIVTHAGGAIRVTTTPGRGTTFRVLLPLVSTPATSAPRRPRPVACGCVLVVEDQPEVRRLVRLILEEERFEVVEAEDGADALRVLGGRPDVQLVLSDISMPKMTGRELTQRLARDRPELPVVLMGGVVDSNVAGLVARVLTKPFRREELVRAIDEALRRT